MKIEKSTLTTTAHFSEDGEKRYLLEKTWDTSKPKLAIIMLAPSEANGVALDSTTLLCLNNASRLGYGSIAIVNLFATLNDFDLKYAEHEDAENMNVILAAIQTADAVVYAAGVGKAKNKAFQLRQKQVLTALFPIANKLNCLSDPNGNARFQHPLSPAVRTWHLSPMKIEELLPAPKEATTKPKSKTTATTAVAPMETTLKKKSAKPKLETE